MRALAVLLVLAPLPALACECEQPDPQHAFAAASAVFEGRVLEVHTEGDARRASIAVVQSWKGADHERIEIVTPASSDACGVELAPQTSWLIYAAGDRTTTCMRTRPIEDAASDLAELGAGVVPVDIDQDDEVEAPAAPAAHRAGCASCAVNDGHSRALAIPFVLMVLSSCRWPSRRAAASRPRRTAAGTRCVP